MKEEAQQQQQQQQIMWFFPDQGGDQMKFEGGIKEKCIRDPSSKASSSSPSKLKDLNISSEEEDHIESISKRRREESDQRLLREYLPTALINPNSHYRRSMAIKNHEEDKEQQEKIREEGEESELVSLSLCTSSKGSSSSSRLRKEEEEHTANEKSTKPAAAISSSREGLSLGGLDYRCIDRSAGRHGDDDHKIGGLFLGQEDGSSSINAAAAAAEDDDGGGGSIQPTLKKTRVSVRARCDTPTMNDGCQWRKYGQKIAKGNPRPRAYFRCTVAPECPVRKQVQRCAEDVSILITTYEGTHNHPLPHSATAMAATTAAAAAMLTSGSSTSASISANISMPNSLTMRSTPSGLSIYNSSASHPTVTLDLTAPPSSSTPYTMFSPALSVGSKPPYPSTFSFSDYNSKPLNQQIPWSNGCLSYGGAHHQPCTEVSGGGSEMASPLGLGHSYLPRVIGDLPPPSSSSLPTQRELTDLIAGAITSHPSFQSALVAAMTSYIGGGARGGQGGREQQQQQEEEQVASPASAQSESSRYLQILNSSSFPNVKRQ